MILFLWSAMIQSMAARTGIPYALCDAYARWAWANWPTEVTVEEFVEGLELQEEE